jgi:hypothetical protein
MDTRMKDGVREFSIKWKGYAKLSWEPESNLDCHDLVKAFMAKTPKEEQKKKEARGRSRNQKKVAPASMKKGRKRTASTTGKSSKKAKKEESEDEERNYEVEKIVSVRFTKNGSREFEIQWKGYAETTWEPENNLECQDALDAFVARVGAKLKDGRK